MRIKQAFALLVILVFVSCEPIPLRNIVAEKVIGSTVIYVDSTATPGGDGKSWSTAYRYLQDALSDAYDTYRNFTWKPTIYVAAGVYYPTDSFQIRSHLKLYGGFPAGGGTRDPARNITVLSGDIDKNDVTNIHGVTEHPADIIGTNANTILSIEVHPEVPDSIEADTVVDGFTLTGSGSSPDVSLPCPAIYCAASSSQRECSPTLSNLIVQGNIGNWASAIWIAGQEGGTCRPVIRNVEFRNNRTTMGATVAVDAYGGISSPRFENVLFQHNEGGAVQVAATGKSELLLINACFIENSTSYPGAGIQLLAFDQSTVTLTLVGAFFEGNKAGGGGACDFSCYSGGTLRANLTNALFVGNTSAWGGGAVSNSGNAGSTPEVTFTNATFVGNAGYSGGAVSNYLSTYFFDNCILWNNSASSGGNEINNNTATAVFTACDVAGSGGSTSWSSALGTDGGGNIDQNPLFTINPNSGDANWTTWSDNDYGNLRLLAGSPAANAGQDRLLPRDTEDLDRDGDTSERIPVDIIGGYRVLGTSVDMGAYESQ
jgi:hypothetical protein